MHTLLLPRSRCRCILNILFIIVNINIMLRGRGAWVADAPASHITTRLILLLLGALSVYAPVHCLKEVLLLLRKAAVVSCHNNDNIRLLSFILFFNS